MNKDSLIYLDMDGVLADFNQHFTNIFNVHPSQISKKELWKNIKEYELTHNFFEEIPLLEGANDLVDFLKSKFTNIQILTATGNYSRNNTTAAQKQRWLEKYFAEFKFNNVDGGINKARYAGLNKVLIDDREDVIVAFTTAGGIGLHYKDCKQMMDQINRLYKE